MARLQYATGLLLMVVLGLSSSPVASAQAPKATSIEADGTLVPSDSTWVYPPFKGVVKKWYCKSGMEVRKGQVIASVASADLQRRVDQVKVEIHSSQAKINALMVRLQKHADADRQMLLEEQVKLRSKINELLVLERIVQGGELRSPFDGTVIIADAEKLLGRKVTTTHPIFRVARLKEDWHASVCFAEKDVGRLLQFLRAEKDTRAVVELGATAFPGKAFKGTLHLNDVAQQMTLREKNSVLHARVRIDEESLKVLRILPIDANVRVKISLPEKQ